MTQIGACDDCATSNKLYSSVWLWCCANKSNSSNTNTTDLLCSPPTKPTNKHVVHAPQKNLHNCESWCTPAANKLHSSLHAVWQTVRFSAFNIMSYLFSTFSSLNGMLQTAAAAAAATIMTTEIEKCNTFWCYVMQKKKTDFNVVYWWLWYACFALCGNVEMNTVYTRV